MSPFIRAKNGVPLLRYIHSCIYNHPSALKFITSA